MFYISLPLYPDADYQYDAAFEGEYYTLRIYYNERAEGWFFELRDGENDMLVAGERLVPTYPVNLYYNIDNLTGFLWLEAIGDEKNETTSNPFELSEYFRLYYVWPDPEGNDTIVEEI